MQKRVHMFSLLKHRRSTQLRSVRVSSHICNAARTIISRRSVVPLLQVARQSLILGTAVAGRRALSAAVASKVDCSKVAVRPSAINGDGAFAACDLSKGEIIEYGIVRRITPFAIQGVTIEQWHNNSHIFRWSEDKTVWAIGSGCSTFYNASATPNTAMKRYFDSDTFEIIALRDISTGEELTYKYRHQEWMNQPHDDPGKNILSYVHVL